MLKSALMASAICFAFIVPASAATTAQCDEASLTAMRAQIDGMSDKEKQKTALGNWEAADAAFKANKLEDCNARVAEASKTLGDTGTDSNAPATDTGGVDAPGATQGDTGGGDAPGTNSN